MYAVKAAFVEKKVILESIAKATVEKNNELIEKNQLDQDFKNTFLNEFIYRLKHILCQ